MKIAKFRKNRRCSGEVAIDPEPALNVVIYRNPKAHADSIEDHARGMVENHLPCRTGGPIGHLTLDESEFDRLWDGLDCDDGIGTASSVVAYLSPRTRMFFTHHTEFIFTWMGAIDPQHGKVLLLQILPAPPSPETRN